MVVCEMKKMKDDVAESRWWWVSGCDRDDPRVGERVEAKWDFEMEAATPGTWKHHTHKRDSPGTLTQEKSDGRWVASAPLLVAVGSG
jgi:hypothetical protein